MAIVMLRQAVSVSPIPKDMSALLSMSLTLEFAKADSGISSALTASKDNPATRPAAAEENSFIVRGCGL